MSRVLCGDEYVRLSSRLDYYITVLFVDKEGARRKINTLQVDERSKEKYRCIVDSPCPNMGDPVSTRGFIWATSCMLVKSRNQPERFWLAIYEEQTLSRFIKTTAALLGGVAFGIESRTVGVPLTHRRPRSGLLRRRLPPR